jgi:2-oxoacid:acceptor oxidoreductase gamma subunit (pyruvate/2-ketoisovalerate family)
MIEIIIHGRGGQGGVTLAKLIAGAYFRAGKYVQAFGLYAAERSGAPVQAFVRIDDREITNHNQIQAPDHVIVLDPTLIGPALASSLNPGGWIMLNTRQDAVEFASIYPGRNIAVVDATGLAIQNGLGTRSVPIVNTTMFGAVARVLKLSIEDVEETLAYAHFSGNVTAWQAFKACGQQQEGGSVRRPRLPGPASLFDEHVRLPTNQTVLSRFSPNRRLEPPCNHICPAE